MNKLLTLSLVILSICLVSCKKKKVTEEPEKPVPVRLLTRVWGTNYFNQTGTTEVNTQYTYDDQNRLIKISAVKGETTSCTYKDGLLTQVEYHVASSTAFLITKYAYQNGKPTGSTETWYREPGVIRSESGTRFIYTEGKVTAIEAISKDKVTGVKKFTYSADNVESYTREDGAVFTYSYDDKKNPYWNKDLKGLMRSTDHFSVNNVIELVTVPFPNV